MGCFGWLSGKFSGLFGGGAPKVSPAQASAIEFPGIGPELPGYLELKTLSRLMSDTLPRGTEDRWYVIDEALRQDLAEPDEDWEEAKPHPPKALLNKARKVYSLRRDHVTIPSYETAKLLKFFDRLVLGHDAEAGREAGGGSGGDASGDAQAAAAKAEAEAAAATGADVAGLSEEDAAMVRRMRGRDYGAAALKVLSMAEREAGGVREDGFEYGEVDPEAFFAFLFRLRTIHGHLLPPKPKPSWGAAPTQKKKKKRKGEPPSPPPAKLEVAETFMDLGSGAGKAVFCAALFFEFKECGGVEMISGLAEAAKELAFRWRRDIGPVLPGANRETKLSFETDDMRGAFRWEEGSYLFLNAPTLAPHTMEQLAIKANGGAVRPESVAIVVSRPWSALDPKKWVLIAEDHLRMTWGTCKVFVYEKLPGKRPPPPKEPDDGKKKKKKKKK